MSEEIKSMTPPTQDQIRKIAKDLRKKYAYCSKSITCTEDNLCKDCSKMEDCITTAIESACAGLVACPCTIADNPCHPQCSCVHGASSSGCYCCAKYGSQEQKKNAANRLVGIQSSLQQAREENEKLKCTTKFICAAHLGAVHVALTEGFELGCPCCHRDESNQELTLAQAAIVERDKEISITLESLKLANKTGDVDYRLQIESLTKALSSTAGQELVARVAKLESTLNLFHLDAEHRGLCTPENCCAACLVLKRNKII